MRWIYPDFAICSNIFGDPYEKSDEKKSDTEVHGIVFLVWSKVYMSFSKSEKHESNDDISEIPDKMM